MSDPIDRQAAIEAFAPYAEYESNRTNAEWVRRINVVLSALPSAQPESTRTFVDLVVEYPDPELCTYKEYKGKPYYSIKYIENGETYVGYGTFNPEVLSQYLKEYFMPSAQPEIIWCKDCRWGQAHAHDGLRICEYHDDFPKMDDDFCSRGEKVWMI